MLTNRVDTLLSVIVTLAVKAKFSTTPSWNEVFPNKCDTDGQREINMAAETRK